MALAMAVIAMFGTAIAAAPPPPDKGVVGPAGNFTPKPAPGDAASPASPPPPVPLSRDQAEDLLGKESNIQQISPGKLKIGLITLDQTARSIRFPATVNMTKGPVEYAIVTDQGKVHESVFVTKTSIRDIHMAMLLLGVKPGEPKSVQGQALVVPAGAAVNATVEWETNGPLASHPLTSMIALVDGDPDQPITRTLKNGTWFYKGSCYDANGFRAVREGSVVALIGDEGALLFHPGIERENDDIHVPNATLLPKQGMPVSIVLTCVPKPKSE